MASRFSPPSSRRLHVTHLVAWALFGDQSFRLPKLGLNNEPVEKTITYFLASFCRETRKPLLGGLFSVFEAWKWALLATLSAALARGRFGETPRDRSDDCEVSDATVPFPK